MESKTNKKRKQMGGDGEDTMETPEEKRIKDSIVIETTGKECTKETREMIDEMVELGIRGVSWSTSNPQYKGEEFKYLIYDGRSPNVSSIKMLFAQAYGAEILTSKFVHDLYYHGKKFVNNKSLKKYRNKSMDGRRKTLMGKSVRQSSDEFEPLDLESRKILLYGEFTLQKSILEKLITVSNGEIVHEEEEDDDLSSTMFDLGIYEKDEPPEPKLKKFMSWSRYKQALYDGDHINKCAYCFDMFSINKCIRCSICDDFYCPKHFEANIKIFPNEEDPNNPNIEFMCNDCIDELPTPQTSGTSDEDRTSPLRYSRSQCLRCNKKAIYILDQTDPDIVSCSNCNTHHRVVI